MPEGVLSAEQARQLELLAETLSAEQALWISGYFASLSAQRTQPAATAQPAGGDAPARVTILYGSETGNAARVAELARERAAAKGLEARLIDMADYKTRELKSETHLLVVTATHGEGDPPDPAAGFYEFVMSRKAPTLADAHYTVLSLGDSTYEHFCQTGKDFDARLEALGATRLIERVDCDVDFDEPAEAWVDRVVAALAESLPAAGEAAPAAGPTGLPASLTQLLQADGAAPRTRPRHDRKNPFEARLLDSIVLNGRGSDKDTRHIELTIEESALAFEPGDSLGIVAENDPALVEAVIEAAGLNRESPVNGAAEERRLADALLTDYEITVLTPPFLKGYAELAGAEELRALVDGENRAPLQRFLVENQVIDVLDRYPAPGLEAEGFTRLLRKMQPRLYSIASSQKAFPDEVHLTVAAVRYDLNGRARKGVASTYLSDRRGLDDAVKVYVEPNKTFKLPEDPATPIIMIGAGTGVAPYRAFLQEREETGAKGPAWLIFGDRRFRTDFLYQTEWQGYLKAGLLTRMDVAWSRDQEEKDYVQHRMLDRARDIYAWLEDGAHLYVCGDAERMAPDLHDALHKVVEREAGVDAEAAASYVRALQEEKRYLRDVY